MAGRLEGKVVLITGTAAGMGREAALHFTREGAIVAGCDLNAKANLETVAMVEKAGGTMVCFGCMDISQHDVAQSLISQAIERCGRIDGLYNNASAAMFAPIAELEPEAWRFTIRNELDSVYAMNRAIWPHFVERQQGVILNVASQTALVGMRGLGSSAHAAAKGAVIALTRQLAVEGGPCGIRVNTLTPGPVETAATAAMFANPFVRAAAAERTLIGRVGQPEDVVPCAAFLLSDEARWITGANFIVDGGWSAF